MLTPPDFLEADVVVVEEEAEGPQRLEFQSEPVAVAVEEEEEEPR
jgi:hypothetical protein